MIHHLNINISGRVQGVIFRASAKEMADRLNITGLVRNESGGMVYIEAEGEEKDLAQFLAWCKKGPPFAKVAKIQTTAGELKNFTQFSVN